MSIVRLAEDLGLSVSTVSRALNGYADVAAETRRRVIQRADEIAYKPHPGARGLKSGKSFTVGVVLPIDAPGGPFMDAMYARLLGGVAAEIEKSGYSLLAAAHSQARREHELGQYESFIRSNWYDAFIVVRTRIEDERVQLLQERRIPFVTYGRTGCSDHHAWVDPDNEGAFHLATRRQIDFGHRRIGLLNGPGHFMFAALRRRGFERALGEAGLQALPSLLVHGELTESAGYAGAMELLRGAVHAPTSLVCATDALAIGAMAACRDRGLRVGIDVSVIGYGNSDAAQYSAPPLSSIEHRVQDNGHHIGQLLMRLMAGEDASRLHYLEPVVLVERSSDGPCPRP
jgi:LacI family transcriptional regulator